MKISQTTLPITNIFGKGYPGGETNMGQGQLTFQIKVPAAELLNQIQKLAQEYSGQLQGDEKSGHVSLRIFVGTIEGDYAIDGDKLTLNITKKPFLVGYETISTTIKEFLTGLA
jgi:hypothetical protein